MMPTTKTDINNLELALSYHQKGFAVIPVRRPIQDQEGNWVCSCKDGANCKTIGKHPHVKWNERDLPCVSEDQVREWWGRWPEANIGVLTGKRSGIMAIDMDGAEGIAEFEALVNEHGNLPRPTPLFISGSGGMQLLFKYPGFEVRNSAKEFAPHVDVRAEGGLTVIPPSLHRSGNLYRWQSEGHEDQVEYSPFNFDVIDAPLWVLDRLEEIAKQKRISETNDLAPGYQVHEGQRNSWLVSKAGQLRHIGYDQQQIKMNLDYLNEVHCDPPVDEKEIVSIVDSICNYKATVNILPCDVDLIRFVYSDTGNAERLIALHGCDVHYCEEMGKNGRWLVWNGRVWEEDKTGEVMQMSKDTIRRFEEQTRGLPERTEEESKIKVAIRKFTCRSENLTSRNAMVELARTEPEIPIKRADLDRDPWLMNVENGVIDLKTGKLRPHIRADLMSKIAPVIYDPDADCPTFKQFLERIFDGDQQLISFVQRAIGYSLTGSTSEQVFFVAYGAGANGKSTLLNIIAKLMSDYHRNTPVSTLLHKRFDGIPNDVARLKGARLITASETTEGRHLDAQLVKLLTGQDKVTARFLNQEFFEFTPEGKIWLITNHKPVIRDDSHGMWRRILLVPFTVTIPEEERDEDLSWKLETELPGILSWVVKGCMDWQDQGLNPPASIHEAKQVYKDENDVLGLFLSECTEVVQGAKVAVSDVYQEYRNWAQENGEINILPQRRLTSSLKDRLGDEGCNRSTGNQYHLLNRRLTKNQWGCRHLPDPPACDA